MEITRRQFLKAGAALALVPRAVGGEAAVIAFPHAGGQRVVVTGINAAGVAVREVLYLRGTEATVTRHAYRSLGSEPVMEIGDELV